MNVLYYRKILEESSLIYINVKITLLGISEIEKYNAQLERETRMLKEMRKGPKVFGKIAREVWERLLVPEFLPRQSTASTLTKTVRHATNARAVARSTNSVPSISLSWMLPATTVLTKSRP